MTPVISHNGTDVSNWALLRGHDEEGRHRKATAFAYEMNGDFNALLLEQWGWCSYLGCRARLIDVRNTIVGNISYEMQASFVLSVCWSAEAVRVKTVTLTRESTRR